MAYALTTPTTATSTVEASDASARPLWRRGVVAALVAAAATTIIATVADAAGVSFAGSDGKAIPRAGFTQLTVLFSLVGVALAAVLARKAQHPRSTFRKVTVGLTALSVLPDFVMGFDGASIAALISSHLVAAAIVIPTLARRLAPTR